MASNADRFGPASPSSPGHEDSGPEDAGQDLTETLQQIVSTACELVSARSGALLVTESDWNVRELVTCGLTDEESSEVAGLPRLHGLLELLLESEQPVRLNSLRDHPTAHHLPHHELAATLLAVPVHLRDAAYGHLYLADKADGQDFTAADEQTVVALGSAAALAIENHRLLGQEQRRQRWLEGCSELTSLLLDEVDLAATTRLATRRFREISGAEYAAVILVDPADPDQLVYQAAAGLADLPAPGTRVPRRGLAAAVLDSGEPIVTDRLLDDPRFDPGPDPHEDLSVLGLTMVLPLAAPGQQFGVLFVGWRRDSPAAPVAAREGELVRTFANHTALVLLRVEAQEARNRRERWLEAAAEMARLLLGEVDRDEAMRLLVDHLREVSGADVAGVLLADPTDPGSVFVVVFEGGGLVPAPPDLRIPRAGLLARVLDTGEPVVSDDYPNEPGHDPPAAWHNALAAVGLGMMLPLTTDGEVLGTLFVAWRRGSPQAPLAREEAVRIQIFADVAALALQRVRTQGDREHLAVLEERDRIALEMRDVIVQQLFGVSLRLRSAGGLSSEPVVRQRLSDVLDDLDRTSRQVRSAIFGDDDHDDHDGYAHAHRGADGSLDVNGAR
ncbi:GAF domain-containing protein [Actinopolymorpha cephalotaxi]|uniref:GAF domain-containing protein n=1 Tax=Actinopolymorpha cephalotaxi TaxID=504797 RepID=A0A1I3AX57_9ACTN|nr:GAF domain-containing protein [Actinopolymorpha cephalotaxi]NYH84312.1 GAF domain-containing protein [Actinopolymorpha cephalotaxi]SFH54582.1 GAF domain-containing protein [Actinopolymorpha cephalotaxi]